MSGDDEGRHSTWGRMSAGTRAIRWVNSLTCCRACGLGTRFRLPLRDLRLEAVCWRVDARPSSPIEYLRR